MRIIRKSLPRMHSVWRHHVHSSLIRCSSDTLLSVIGRILQFFVMASETPWIYAMFGCKFTPGVEKCNHSFPKDVILTNIWLKKSRRSDGAIPYTARMCSLYFSYPLKYAFFNLLTPLMWNINSQYKIYCLLSSAFLTIELKPNRGGSGWLIGVC